MNNTPKHTARPSKGKAPSRKRKRPEENLEPQLEVEQKVESGEYEVVDGTSKSAIWIHFQRICTKVDNKFTRYVICKHCKVIKAYSSFEGTSNLIRHRCVEMPCSSNSKEKYIIPEAVKEAVTEAAVELCCGDLRPFEITSRKGFKQFVSCILKIGAQIGVDGVAAMDVSELLPHPTTTSRNVAKRHMEEREALVREIQPNIEDGSLAATTDMFTELYRQRCFTTATVHFIDKDWTLRRRTLFTKEFPAADSENVEIRKTGSNVLAVLQSKFEDCGISQDQMARIHFVTDQGANIKKALKDVDRSNCCAHILNNIVQAVLDKDFLQKECPILHKCLQSSKALVEFFKRSGHSSLLSTSLKQSCKSRWSSTETMLKSIALVYPEIQEVLRNRRQQTRLNGITVDKLEGLIELLTPLREATDVLQQDKVPTSCLIILQIETLKKSLRQSIAKFSQAACTEAEGVDGDGDAGLVSEEDVDDFGLSDQEDVHAINETKEKVKKQSNSAKTNDQAGKALLYVQELIKLAKKILALVEERFKYTDLQKAALYLHPKYRQMRCLPSAKLEEVEAFIEKECEMYEIADTTTNSSSSNTTIDTSESTLVSSSAPAVSESVSVPEPVAESSCKSALDEWADLPLDSLNTDESAIKKELGRYRTAAYKGEAPLEWWKENEKSFPLLSRLAKKVLCIPASSAPSERVFSIAGRALEERRINLADDNVDGILFLHSLLNNS